MDNVSSLKTNFEKDIKKIIDDLKESTTKSKTNISNEINLVEKNMNLLEKEIGNLKEPYLSKFKQKLSKEEIKPNGRITNYDEFIYYIDRINELDYPKHIIDKNPQFCNLVIEKLIEYYLNLKENLNITHKAKKKDYSNVESIELQKHQRIMQEKIDNYYKKLLEIATKEVEDISSSLLKEVMC